MRVCGQGMWLCVHSVDSCVCESLHLSNSLSWLQGGNKIRGFLKLRQVRLPPTHSLSGVQSQCTGLKSFNSTLFPYYNQLTKITREKNWMGLGEATCIEVVSY